MRIPLQALTIVLVISLLPISLTAAQTTLSWNIQTVDENATTGGSSPIAVDSNNIAHIAYTALINGKGFVMYASWNGSGCSTQAIVNGGPVTSLVLDEDSMPHILYDGAQMYASWTGTNWSIQNTGITNVVNPALALDADGNPHVAYVLGDELKYTSWTETGWVTQTIENVTVSGGLSSLVFSKDNTAYLLYHVPCSFKDDDTGQEYQSLTVKLATLKGSSWNIQTVSLPQPIYDNGNLVLDSNGNLHFAFTQFRYRSLNDKSLLLTLLYATSNGSAWSTEIVISNFQAGYEPSGSLSLDSGDNPHICSFIPEFSRITYISWTGTTWVTQNVDLDRPGVLSCALALDGNGNPHISYRALSPIRFRAPLVYVTANETEAITQTPTATNLIVLLIAAIAIIACLFGVTYILRSQSKKVKQDCNG